MRGPSPRMPVNQVNLYRYRPGEDADAGAVADETTLIAAAVDCSVQPTDVTSEVVNKRVRQTFTYDVFFFANPTLAMKDLIVWVDDQAVSHSLFVIGQLNQAGRSTCWKVKAREVI